MLNKKNGFSLVEIILFIVVFSLGVTGVMVIYYNTLGKTGDPLLRHRALLVLQGVMEQIYSKKWDENTPEGGCSNFENECKPENSHIGPEGEVSVNDFDDIDDYVNRGTIFRKTRKWKSEDLGLTPGYNIIIDIGYADIDSSGIIHEYVSKKTDYKIITVEILNDRIKERYKLVAVKANF